MMPSNSSKKEIVPTIEEAIQLAQQLPADRINKLGEIKGYIQSAIAEGKIPRLVFICTHNSRRSHFGQVWAKVMADYYGFTKVETYSGGTEATAFNPNAIAALRSQGFVISTEDVDGNPLYAVQYAETAEPQSAWSKKYDDPKNPKADFCAIMTCTEADEACPVVFGASARVALPYVDPKKSDGTPEQAATYQARSLQIASEMAFLFASL
ncbi:MAG: protein-tyrosine-phosphatase [Bacteroidota bacterium]